MATIAGEGTEVLEYTTILESHSGKRWKKILDVQRPYRAHIKRMKLGRTLDIGCGIGRNLLWLSDGSLGIDHNGHSVAISRKAGLNAISVDEYEQDKQKYIKDGFDSMLLAHVLEHMSTDQGVALIKGYLPYVKSRVVIICPQERGYRSDDTHVNFLRHQGIEEIMESCGLQVVKSYSFPFHRRIGKVFQYNETVVIGQKKVSVQ